MKKAAKVFIWIGMIAQFYLVFPIFVGIKALKSLETINNKQDLKSISILTLIFCNILAGIFMLNIDEEDIRYNVPQSTYSFQETNIGKIKAFSILTFALLLGSTFFNNTLISLSFNMVMILVFLPILVGALSSKCFATTEKVLLRISIILTILNIFLVYNSGLGMIKNSIIVIGFNLPMIVFEFILLSCCGGNVKKVDTPLMYTKPMTVKDELEKLKELYEENLISEEDYNERKSKVLDKYYK